jgi:chromosome segregation ATPase
MASIMASIITSAEESNLVCFGLGAAILAASLAIYIIFGRGQQDDDDDFDTPYQARPYAFFLVSFLVLALSFFAGLTTYLAHGDAISAWAAALSTKQISLAGMVFFHLLLACANAKYEALRKELSAKKQIVKEANSKIKLLKLKVEVEKSNVQVAKLETEDLQSRYNTLENNVASERSAVENVKLQAKLDNDALTRTYKTKISNLYYNLTGEIKQLSNSREQIIVERDESIKQLETSQQEPDNKDQQIKQMNIDHQQIIRDKDGEFRELDGNYQNTISQNKDLTDELKTSREDIQKLNSDHEQSIREKDGEFQKLDAIYQTERSKVTALETASLEKDSKIETLESRYEKLETAKTDLEKTSNGRYSELEELYHSNQNAGLSKDTKIDELERQCRDLLGQKDSSDKEWTRKHAELEGQYEKANLAKDKDIGDLKKEKADSDKWWFNKFRAERDLKTLHENASIAKDGKLRDLERSCQASISKAAGLDKKLTSSRQEVEKLKGKHQKSISENEGLTEKLNGSLQEIKELKKSYDDETKALKSSHQEELNGSHQKIEELEKSLQQSDDDANALKSSHQEELNGSHQKIEELKKSLQKNDDETKALKSSHQEELNGRLQEIEELKRSYQQNDDAWGRVTEDANSFHEEELQDEDQSCQKALETTEDVYDEWIAERIRSEYAELHKRDDKIATLRDIVRSAASTPEGEDSECASLKDELAREQEVSKTARERVEKLQEELVKARGQHRARKNRKTVRQNGRHAEQDTDDEEETTAPESPVALRPNAAPFAFETTSPYLPVAL